MSYEVIAYESQGSTSLHTLKNIPTLEEARVKAKALIEQAFPIKGFADILDDELIVVDTVFRKDPEI